jgi:undecaprenyl-diphosphatase
VVVLVAAAAAYLAARRGLARPALALALGVLAIIFLVGATKHAWDRPRPVGRYYDPGGRSYPSGHAAYAIVFLTAAMLTGRRALIAGAVVVAVSIGVARLYLHVHYLTDVLGGFALGTAVFAPVLARRA